MRTIAARLFLTTLPFFLASCEDAPSTPSQSYPTIYMTLSNAVLDSLRAQFAAENPDNCSTLDEYGFTRQSWPCGNSGDAPCASADSLIAAATADLIRNGRFTGLAPSEELRVRWSACSPGSIFDIRFENQLYDGLEVFFTQILVHIDGRGVYATVGHHYPEIYVPDPTVTPRAAQESILGLEIPWEDFAGQQHTYVVGEDSFIDQPFRAIYPVVLENRIELHVTWCIPADGWRVYVDTMTKERIAIQQLFVT